MKVEHKRGMFADCKDNKRHAVPMVYQCSVSWREGREEDLLVKTHVRGN